MYSSIIEIKKNVPSEMLANLRRATERAFSALNLYLLSLTTVK